MAGWTERGARVLRAAANLLHDDDALPAPPNVSRILDDDDLLAIAGDHGLSLLDEDCHGYLIIRLVDVNDTLKLTLEHVMPRQAWPAVRRYLGELHEVLR